MNMIKCELYITLIKCKERKLTALIFAADFANATKAYFL